MQIGAVSLGPEGSSRASASRIPWVIPDTRPRSGHLGGPRGPRMFREGFSTIYNYKIFNPRLPGGGGVAALHQHGTLLALPVRMALSEACGDGEPSEREYPPRAR
jgi:hypothetical protein